MAHYILDKAYTTTDAAGVEACRVVIHGANAGEAALADPANTPGILGVTVHAQPNTGRNVSVRKAGIARVIAASPIAVGEPVNVSGSGKIKAVDEMAGTAVHCLGFAETAAEADGDIIEVFLSLHQRIA